MDIEATRYHLPDKRRALAIPSPAGFWPAPTTLAQKLLLEWAKSKVVRRNLKADRTSPSASTLPIG